MSTRLDTRLQSWRGRFAPLGWVLALVGAALTVASIHLPWSWGHDALDDVGHLGGPSPLQFCAGALGVLTLVALVAARLTGQVRVPAPRHARLDLAGSARWAALGLLGYVAVAAAAIAVELGGLVNLEYGLVVALVGAVLAVVGSQLLAPGPVPTLVRVSTRGWLEVLVLVAVLGLGLLAAVALLGQDDPGAIVLLLVLVVAALAMAQVSGVAAWLGILGRPHRRVLLLATFVVVLLFPLTQNGSDATMSVATQVLVFAATALGLNIVVGLAGLLDLGYIAFLGAGAFTAAILSESAFSTVNFHPPFSVVVLISAAVSGALGLIIGSPTLRVAGDYLAIVTLAFGEIFRLTMINLDGSNGPDLTHGSNGIPGVPDLRIAGFDFGESHQLGPIEVTRFANYYVLLVGVLALIVLIVTRLDNSRIGRGWVAIREDEKAAEAMGVNVFGLKLLAFAGGAALAGVAGAVKAHADISVTPDQYQFLESAFLLAAVVLGGMGTVVGVIVGAVVLKLLPEKLRAVADLRLLLFGVLLIVMMRFRPQGLFPDRRRQLELHRDEDAEGVELPLPEGAR